ncbi:hypothetical protein Glove_293g6 [Diversispora epigaea]|uniref:Transmembrane protein n=1 Tax=Diversispora epigaea TaxID=1348612 RepID=A0A397I618_9GLOM|nr:hypothetical protein Glove_293g6 [Diversispora epigaea]
MLIVDQRRASIVMILFSSSSSPLSPAFFSRSTTTSTTSTYPKLYLKASKKLLQPQFLLLIFAVSIGLFITCVVLVDFQDDNEDIVEEEEGDE